MNCFRCGANLALVGRTHRCVASPADVASVDMANTPHLANKHTADVAIEQSKAPGRNRSASTYRYRNSTKRRLYQRDLMRQRRATGRAA